MQILRFQFRYILAVCLLFFGISLWWEAKGLAESQKNRFLGELERHIESAEQEYLDGIEFQIRRGSLPFYAEETLKRIFDRNRLNSIKAYDDTFRLIYSYPQSKEVFLAELRHSPNLLLPGKTKILNNGETVYRTLSGKFFLSFIRPTQDPVQLFNPNLEFGFLYWTFDSQTGQIIYTNDSTVLNGDTESQKLHITFKGAESQKIAFSYNGTDGKLVRLKAKSQEVYILQDFKFLPKGAWGVSFLKATILFTILIFISINDQTHRLFTIFLNSNKIQQLVCYVLLILLYQFCPKYLPEERVFLAWEKFRFSEIHSFFQILEKELLFAGDRLQLEEGTSISWTHSVFREVEVWEVSGSEAVPQAWAGGGSAFFSGFSSSEIPRIYPIENHSVFLVPIEGNKQTVVLGRLTSEPLFAKKEKDRDEIYSPVYSIGKIEPRKTEFSKRIPTIEGNDFSRYEVRKPKEIGKYFKGLYLWKSEGTISILPAWAYSFSFPLLGLSFFRWFSKRKRRKLAGKQIEIFTPESINLEKEQDQQSANQIESQEIESQKQEAADFLIENKDKPFTEKNPEVGLTLEKKEAEELPESAKIEEMKPHKTEFFPPSSWKKFDSKAEVQKKRESIFTSELKELVQTVTEKKELSANIVTFPKHGNQVPKKQIKIPKLESKANALPSLQEMEKRWLDAIYTKSEVSSEGLLDFLKIKVGNIGSRFSLLSLNSQLGSYTNTFSSGLDYSTKSNLIFLYKDPFFSFDQEGFFELILTDEWRRDVFLSKKFSWEILSQSEVLLAYDLNLLGFEGILILLLDKREVGLWKPDRKKKLQHYMRELIPALHKVARDEWEESEVYGDSLTWQIRSFIHATMGGQRELYVTRVIWENFISEPANEIKKSKIFQNLSLFLNPNDAILETSSNSFLVLSEKELKTEIILQLKSFPFPYDIKFMHYPTDGENYYLYF